MGEATRRGAEPGLGDRPVRPQSRKNRLARIPRITSADYVIQGVLKIVWDDGHEGIVDLRPTISRGRIFTHLQSPENFRNVTVGEYGHSIGWVTPSGDEIDMDSYALRLRSDNQAKLQHVVAALNH